MAVELCASGRLAYPRSRFKPAALAVALSSAFGIPSATVLAQTLPTGGVAIHGQAAISNPSPNQLKVVTQNGPGTSHSAINWQSFSIGAGNSATFVQPSAASTSINRVVSNTPSVLLGNLSSNGRLVLVNQSGIAVGAGAVIDTAGFTASALRMSDADALAGRLRFGDASALGVGSVTVDGRITASNGDVVLVAPNIDVGTSALVQAPNGSTVLAAGQQVEITGRGLEGISLLVQAPSDQVRNLGRLEGNAAAIFAGTLRHSGEIQATAASLEGGTVVLKATGDAYVEGAGRIIATGTKGGKVDVLGHRVAVADQALVDVSGTNGGGSIRIGGDYQGKNAAVPNAARTYLGPDATLRADATESGNGGRVIVWADELTKAYGTISARGGPLGGDGGFAEVSGKHGLVFEASVDLRAPHGALGTLLLDPDFIEVVDFGSSSASQVDQFSDGPGSSRTVDPDVLDAVGGNVTLQSDGDITFTSALTLTTPGAGLTALAGNMINVGAPITTTGGAVLLYSAHPLAAGSGSTDNEAIYVHSAITTNGGAITLQADSCDLGCDSIYINANLNAGAGTITLTGVGDVRQTASSVLVGGNLFATADSTITLDQLGNNISGGVDLFTNVGTAGSSSVAFRNSAASFMLHGAVAKGNVSIDGTGSMATDGIVQSAAGNVVLNFVGGLNFGDDVVVNAGTLSLQSTNNAISQSGGGMVVAGATTVSAGTGAIFLPNAGNNFSSVSVSGGNIAVSDDNALNVTAFTRNVAGANLSFDAGIGALTIPAGAINTGAGQLYLFSGGSFTTPGDLTASHLQLRGSTGLTLAHNLSTPGTLLLQNSTGSVSQSAGSIVAGGATTVSGTGSSTITLTRPGNNFLSVSATGGSISLVDTNALELGAINASSLSVSAGSHVTQSAGVVVSGTTSINAGAGDVALTTAGNNLNILNVTGQAIHVIEGAGSALTVNSISSGLNQPVTLNAGHDLTLPASPINTGTANLSLSSGNLLTIPGALTGNNIVLDGAAAGIFITAPVAASGSLSINTTGPASLVDIHDNVTSTGAMNINLAGGLSVHSGAGVDATLTAGAAQTIDAKYVEVIASGVNAASILTTAGNQSITTHGKNGGGEGLAVKAAGTGDASIRNNAGGAAQTITVIDADLAQVRSVTGGAGSASINTNSVQTITVRGTGNNLLVVGDATGAGSSNVYGFSQSITAGLGGELGGIQMVGGTTDGKTIHITNNGGAQTISTAGTVSLVAGSAPGAGSTECQDSGSCTFIYNSGINTNQTVTANGIAVQGGTGGSFNGAFIGGDGSQFITVGAGGLTLTGGSGAGTRKLAGLNQKATAGTQSVTVNSGGSIIIQGGSTSGFPVSSGSFAGIESSGVLQSINFTAGGDLRLTGGTVGDGNDASVLAHNGAQTITGATLIQLRGGANGGTASLGNGAFIAADAGNQTISAQTITLQGGAAGVGNTAVFNTTKIQNITAGSGGLSLTGGGGTTSSAGIVQGGNGGSQTITVGGGGDISLQGGSSAAQNVGTDNGSMALIRSSGTSTTQLIEFTAPGSVLSLTGGSVGSFNLAAIEAGSGNLGQTIRGSTLANAPSIVLTGGASGGVSTETNDARISTTGAGLQTISAAGGTLLTGGGPFDNSAYIVAATQALSFSGNLSLTGGSSASSLGGARIGGRAVSNTNLNLAVTGNVTVSAGSTSGAAIGSSSTGVGSTNTIVINAGGNVVLNPSATAGTRIGSPAVDVQGGSISVTAGGDILLNTSGGGVAAIRSLGNVSLTATNGAITEATDGLILANALTANAHSGILLDSTSNQVTNLNAANSTSGSITYTQAPGTLLTVTGVNSAAGNVTLKADDLDITGPVNLAGIGSVVLVPTTVGRNTRIESGHTGGVLSLSPADLSQVFTTAGTLSIGTVGSDTTLATSLASSDSNAAFVYLYGNNIADAAGAGVGTSGTPFNHGFFIYALNDVQLTQGSMFLANERQLNIRADGDSSGVGNVNIGAVTLQAGANASNLFGQMTIAGANVNVGVSGNGSSLVQVTGTGPQTITAANNLTLTNSNTGSGSLSVRTLGGDQFITAGNNLSLFAGTGTDTSVFVQSDGGQTVSATGLMLQGGASGFGNSSWLTGMGNQSVTVGGVGIQLTGGGGTGADTDNKASITHGATTGNQSITVNGGGGITITGGSSALQGVGGSGHGSFANINSETGTQTITLSAGGLNLSGGTQGSRNYAGIFSTSGAQTITGAASINLTTGSSGGVDTEGNRAIIDSGTGAQTISATSLLVRGGSGGAENFAQLSSGGSQSVTANSIQVLGGSGGGGTNTGNLARITAFGNQQITVGAGGLTITGGAGTGGLSDNLAIVYQGGGGAGTSQTITMNNGGDITLQGGSTDLVNTGGFGHGSFAAIQSDGGAQTINFGGLGGDIVLTAGTNGSRNLASIYAPNGSQTITGATSITLTGGSSGGFAGEGNGAGFQAGGVQTITTQGLTLQGGAGGIENYAELTSQTGQNITVNDAALVSIKAGANKAGLFSAGNQTLTIQGASSANALEVGSASSASNTYITGNNQVVVAGQAGQSGSITIQGGTVAAKNAGIFNNSGTQTITTSGILALTGGTAVGSTTSCDPALGSGACGDISSSGTGLQRVTANAIQVQGGTAGIGNGAGIFVNGGPMQLDVGSGGLTLTAGSGTSSNVASIGGSGSNGQTLTLNVAGNTLLDASNNSTGSSAFIGLGGAGDLGSINIVFNGTGDLTLRGSNVTSATGAAIGAGGNQTNATSNIDIHAANVSLLPGTMAGVRIGHPAASNALGTISVTATGTITLGDNGTVGSAILTTGDVALHADGAGKLVTQSPNAIIVANNLAVSANAGITLPGSNQVSTFSASSGGGDIAFNNAQSLAVGAISTPAGVQNISISATGGSSSLSLGASTTDDNWTLVAGGSLSLAGAFSGNNLSFTSGAALTLGQNLAAAGSLNLITPNGNPITQTAGTLTVGGTTTLNAVGGDITLTGTGNDFGHVGATGGTVRIRDANGMALDNINVSALVVQAAGPLTLSGAISATAVGDAVALASSSGTLDASSGSISTPNGRWLLYLAAPGAHAFGPLAPDFIQYNATLLSTILGSGDGLLYGLAPTIGASLGTGTPASKTYDGNTSIDVSNPAITVAATGVVPGDTVTLTKVGTGVLDDKNVGSGKNVTVGVQIASATSGAMPVFGYTFLDTGTASSSASAAIGDVTAASITAITGITAANKVYDTTTAATLNTSGASLTGLVGGDVVGVASAVGSFDTKNVGTGKSVSIGSIVLSGAAAANYAVSGASTTANITPATLGTVSGVTAANKVYDGLVTATIDTSSAIVGGVLGSDVVSASGGTGVFVDKNAGVGKTVNITGLALTGADAGNYIFAGGGASTTANITPAVISAVTGITASKTYDGSTSITLDSSNATASFAGMVAGDSLAVGGGAGSFASKDIGAGKSLSVSALSLGGTDAGNYTLAATSGSGTVTVTPLSLATWVGSGGDQFWSNPLNWSNGTVTGAIPDGANVLAVSIPAGVGTIDMNVPGVNLQAITSASLVSQSTGSIVSDQLTLVTQGGISLTNSANQIAQLSASNTLGGNIEIANTVNLGRTDALRLLTISNDAGNIGIVNTGPVITGAFPHSISASGNISIVAKSPLTVGTGGITAGGDIVLSAGNLQSPGPTDNLTLDGPVNSSAGSVTLVAGNNLVQNSAVFGALGVTADAGAGRTFGPLATTNNSPIAYRVGGVSVDPPPTSLGASTPILQETAKQVDVLVTFLDLFEKAVDEQQAGAGEETNPDGTKKKKDTEAIVTEGEVCK